jgi:hypothetical protein
MQNTLTAIDDNNYAMTVQVRRERVPEGGTSFSHQFDLIIHYEKIIKNPGQGIVIYTGSGNYINIDGDLVV